MAAFINFAIFTLSHSRLKELVAYLAALSILTWGGVLVTTIIRSIASLAYRRIRTDE
jgi:hypothetical protein